MSERATGPLPPPDVPPDCAGDRPRCLWRNPQWIMPSLPCHQRCLLGAGPPGSAAWYRQLMSVVRGTSGPVYLAGAAPSASAERRFESGGVSLRAGLVWSVASLDSTTTSRLLSRTAHRDARRAERRGLKVEAASDAASVEQFAILLNQIRAERGLPALPSAFAEAERSRGAKFAVLLALRGEVAVGGRLLVSGDGWARIVEGGSLKAYLGDEPEALLTVAAAHWAAQQGCSALDYGLTPREQQGLRSFKRRMGFAEWPVGCQLVTRAPQDPTYRGQGPSPSVPRPAFGPAREDIALLERCNFACGFCYREPWVPELDHDQVKRRIDEIASRRGVGIALSGGEPTLRSDLFDLLRYAREVGVPDLQLHSNGWRAADPAYAMALRAAGLSSAMISLHSHEPVGFSAITRASPEFFARTVQAIHNLRSAGVYVILSHVINSVNFRHLPDYFRFIAEEFAGIEVFVFFVYPSVKGQAHPELIPRLSEVEPYWRRAVAVAERHNVAVTVDSLAGLPLCFMRGHEHLSRSAYALEQERATDGAVDDHRVKAPEMRHTASCASCRWHERCPGFWAGYFDLHGEGEFTPI